MTIVGLIQSASPATSRAGDYSLVGEFLSVDIPPAAVVITPGRTIFDNTGGSAAGYVGATTTTWLAEKFCLRTQSYGLESLTLLLVSADNGGEARGGEVRLRIYYSNDPVTGKPGSDTGVNMVLVGRSNPITLPIGYTETPIEWRPATPFVLAPNQCYWAVLSTDVGIVVQPDTYAAADGDAGSFGRITSQDGGASWNSPDNFTSRKMLIRGVPLSSGPPPAVETLYAANGSDKTITKFTTNGVSSLFASTGPSTPLGLAFDTAGNLYAAVSGDKILKFTPEGAQSVFADTLLVTPAGLAVDGAGNLYVANNGNHTIAKFTSAGVGSIFAASGLTGPTGLAFDGAGNLYVANGNSRIMKFTPEGVGSFFAETGLYPTGLAFDRAGNLYAALAGGYSIQKFTPEGVSSVFASSGLNATWGLAFDSAGNLYAANSGDNTIQKFKPDGTGSLFRRHRLAQPNVYRVHPSAHRQRDSADRTAHHRCQNFRG